MKPSCPHMIAERDENPERLGRCWCCPEIIEREEPVMVGMAIDHDGDPTYITEMQRKIYVIHYDPITVKRGHGRRGSVLQSRDMSETA